MNYLADTVSIVHHLRRQSKLGEECRRVLSEADLGLHHVFISAVTLMEVLYLAESKRITLPLSELLQKVERSTNYSIIPIDSAVVQIAQSISDVPELHDRILVATAVSYQVPILTPDYVIASSQHVNTVWE